MNLSVTPAQSPNFKASYRTYFFTNDGKRILSEENMKKCLHYMEAHLNGSKRVKSLNQDLRTTMKYGKKLPDGRYTGGDRDYWINSHICSVPRNSEQGSQGYVTILTGDDVDFVRNTYGKPIGIAKRESKELTGSSKSFESSYAGKIYASSVPEYAEKKAVYVGDKRVAFGISFTPVYKKNGELKGFEYCRSGFFADPKQN